VAQVFSQCMMYFTHAMLVNQEMDKKSVLMDRNILVDIISLLWRFEIYAKSHQVSTVRALTEPYWKAMKPYIKYQAKKAPNHLVFLDLHWLYAMSRIGDISSARELFEVMRQSAIASHQSNQTSSLLSFAQAVIFVATEDFDRAKLLLHSDQITCEKLEDIGGSYPQRTLFIETFKKIFNQSNSSKYH